MIAVEAAQSGAARLDIPRPSAIVKLHSSRDVARRAEADGLQVVVGNATEPRVLRKAGIEHTSKLLIAIPEGFEGGVIAERARALNPDLPIIARAHSDAEVAHLERLGARHVVMGERETAARMFALAAEVRAAASGLAAPQPAAGT